MRRKSQCDEKCGPFDAIPVAVCKWTRCAPAPSPSCGRTALKLPWPNERGGVVVTAPGRGKPRTLPKQTPGTSGNAREKEQHAALARHDIRGGAAVPASRGARKKRASEHLDSGGLSEQPTFPSARDSGRRRLWPIYHARLSREPRRRTAQRPLTHASRNAGEGSVRCPAAQPAPSSPPRSVSAFREQRRCAPQRCPCRADKVVPRSVTASTTDFRSAHRGVYSGS